MVLFDFLGAGAVRQQFAPSAVVHSTALQERPARPRATLRVIGTVLVLMSVGMGVLTIRFILVVAHTLLQ
jgi:hypothetical protein